MHSSGLSHLAHRDSLGDEGFHQIYEALFRSVSIERRSYINSFNSSKSSNAVNRLRDCAVVFRLAVELGIRKISSKTVNALIDHIIDTLPVAEEGYCLPLIEDYLKILKAILEHAAHVEHLRGRKWRTLADFLVQAISHYAVEAENSSSAIDTSAPSQHSRNGRVTSFRVSQSSGSRTSQYEAGRPAEELFFCLDRLTKSTNAPTMSKANLILDCMMRFFNSTPSSSVLHPVAFSCVNNITAKVITEDSRLAQRVILELLPTIRRLWPSKDLLLRDEMLITLVLSSDIIKALPETNSTEDVHSSLHNLLEVVSAEYSRRSERDILQLDEISFTPDPMRPVMSVDNFCIRPEHTRATFKWATINVLAFITLTVDRFSEVKTTDTSSKRVKLTNSVDDVFRQSISASNSEKARALQIIPLLLNSSTDVPDKFMNVIANLTKQILDEDCKIAAWTMIALSR